MQKIDSSVSKPNQVCEPAIKVTSELTDSPPSVFKTFPKLLQDVSDSLKWGLPLTILSLCTFSFSLVGLIFAKMYRTVHEGNLYRQLSTTCKQDPSVCGKLLLTTEFANPGKDNKESTSDTAVEAVTYSLIACSISALCFVAQDAWRQYFKMRKWVKEMNRRPEEPFSMLFFLLERFRSDPLLSAVLAGSVVLAIIFIASPPEIASFVMPLWERISIVLSVIFLFANAWILSGRCALEVCIPKVELEESEGGPVWVYHIHVSCGKEHWVVLRRHPDFQSLCVKLLAYGGASDGPQVPMLVTTVPGRLSNAIGGGHFSTMVITHSCNFAEYFLKAAGRRRHTPDEQIEEKRRTLEAWLQDVINHPDLGAPYRTPCLKNFLRKQFALPSQDESTEDESIDRFALVTPITLTQSTSDDEWVILTEALTTVLYRF